MAAALLQEWFLSISKYHKQVPVSSCPYFGERRLALCVIGGGHPLLAGIDGGDNSLFQMLGPGPHNGCWPGSQGGDNERESWYTLSLIVLDISGVIIMDGPRIHRPILSQWLAIIMMTHITGYQDKIHPVWDQMWLMWRILNIMSLISAHINAEFVISWWRILLSHTISTEYIWHHSLWCCVGWDRIKYNSRGSLELFYRCGVYGAWTLCDTFMIRAELRLWSREWNKVRQGWGCIKHSPKTYSTCSIVVTRFYGLRIYDSRSRKISRN